MKRVAILQSNYLPWRGYFDLIDDAALLIILDEVQYTKDDWRNRNRIKTASGAIWLTVPVHFKLGERLAIDQTPIAYQRDWTKKHIASITQAYSKAPYFNAYAEELFATIAQRPRTISELNVSLLGWICRQLRITTCISQSRSFSPQGVRTERLLDLLRKSGATHYLSGPAAKAYLDEQRFSEEGIALEYKSYCYEEYPQLHEGFDSRLSVIDLLFNCGPDARVHLKSTASNELKC